MTFIVHYSELFSSVNCSEIPLIRPRKASIQVAQFIRLCFSKLIIVQWNLHRQFKQQFAPTRTKNVF